MTVHLLESHSFEYTFLSFLVLGVLLVIPLTYAVGGFVEMAYLAGYDVSMFINDNLATCVPASTESDADVCEYTDNFGYFFLAFGIFIYLATLQFARSVHQLSNR